MKGGRPGENIPAFVKYVDKLDSLEFGQQRRSNLGSVYTILAIEASGYVICRRARETTRLWCDLLESMELIGHARLKAMPLERI